ncbi:MAG: PHP domain-containing protein [Rhodothermaceae bacterium]
MKEKIDLHIHTTYSDGIYTPFQIVKKAKDAGIDTISITDHDSVNGIEGAIMFGNEIGVTVIPGLEISTDIEDQEVHILGYFIDHNSEELRKYLSFFRDERLERAKRMVKKLNKLNVDINLEEILERAKNSAVGRPHIATALVEAGYCKSYYDAFARYIGDEGPAYERKIHVSPQSALKLIKDAGGLSFIAHPGKIKESILQTLINFGVDGIEVIHPSHSGEDVKFYRGIIDQYWLLESGGSDFHGGKKNDDKNFGKFFITPDKLDAMKKTLNLSIS